MEKITSDNSPLSLPIQSRSESTLEVVFGSASVQSRAQLPQPATSYEVSDSVVAHTLARFPHFSADLNDYLRASVSESTRRAYRQDIQHFHNWGGHLPSSAEQVANYLAGHGGVLSPHTLGRKLVAIGRAHRELGYANPCEADVVRSTLRGIRRIHGAAQWQVDPLLKEDVLAIVDALPLTLKGCRDRALLLMGFAGALRRSELVGLNIEDLKFVPEGMVIRLRRCKTDQEAEGRDIGIPYARSRACPVKAVHEWLHKSGITCGPIFRGVAKGGHIQPTSMTSQSVALVIKHWAVKVGLDPCNVSGHSLRAGLITSAAKLGVSAWKIRAQSGHRSEAMLSRYIRDGELFVNNAAGAVL